MSADPYLASGGAGNPGSWNRYAYVEGDPVNFNDPQGLFVQAPHDFGFGGESIEDIFGFQRTITSHTSPAQKKTEKQRVQLDPAITGAEQRLKDPNCAKLSGDTNASAALRSAADENRIRIAPFGNNISAGVGAQVNRSINVIYIVEKRWFFSGVNDGKSVLALEEVRGLSIGQMREAALIHEMLHLTGIVGADNKPDIEISLPTGETVRGSRGVSAAVKEHCFK